MIINIHFNREKKQILMEINAGTIVRTLTNPNPNNLYPNPNPNLYPNPNNLYPNPNPKP